MNLEQAKKAFAEYDYDNDGFITLQEYAMGCRANGNMVKDDDLIKMFKIFDENHDNKLDLNEFINSVHFFNLTRNYQEVDCLEIRDAFKAFDTNDDGKITLQEYIDGNHANGNHANDAALTRAFRLFDVDHDGFIDREEFQWAVSYVAATAYDRDPNLNSSITFGR